MVMDERCWKVTVSRNCDRPQEVCQSVGRCDGHGEKYRGLGRSIT